MGRQRGPRTRRRNEYWGKAQPSYARPPKTKVIRATETTSDTADALAVVKRVLGRRKLD